MARKKRTSKEILEILAQVITPERKTIHALVSDTKALGDPIWSEAIQNHIDLIILVQELFADKKIVLEEYDAGKNVVRVVYSEAKK